MWYVLTYVDVLRGAGHPDCSTWNIFDGGVTRIVPRGTFSYRQLSAALFHVEHFHNILPFAQRFELSPPRDVA